jgi:exosome complex component RRP40
LERSQKRYIPAEGDEVIGVVVDKLTEAYRVDFGGSVHGTLGMLEFDGASKRNKPNLHVGDTVYARISAVDRDIEPELSCKVVDGPKKDWMTGEALYGALQGGCMVKVGLSHAMYLLRPRCALLATLGEAIPFEIVVGMNGYVWTKAENASATMIASNAVVAGEGKTDSACRGMVRRLLASLDDTGDA